jgi:predicted metal-dependent phosphoesterase TrpH
VIDLHLHTTASDGLLPPSALVARAAAAGLTVVSVTDHDTLAGLPEARAAAGACGVRLIDGVEITAIEGRQDVHLLGYFFDPSSPQLTGFLLRQRDDRLRRLQEVLERLAALGVPIDGTALVNAARSDLSKTIGRPQVADAMVAAGHSRDRSDAFDRWLGEGRPAFVQRRGSSLEEVIGIIARAGGLSSLAHPGPTNVDAIIPRLASAGLTALEVRHSDHDAEAERRYRAIARRAGLACSGGSDFHGDGMHEARGLGVVTLPVEDFAELESRRR